MSTEPLARIQYAEDGSNPLLPYICRAEEGDDFYEIPEALIEAYERAKAAMRAAEDAIAQYITDNGLQPQDGFVAAGWTGRTQQNRPIWSASCCGRSGPRRLPPR